jgi:hypothetical protein
MKVKASLNKVKVVRIMKVKVKDWLNLSQEQKIRMLTWLTK